MPKEQISVRLNPDVPPTGSDLACVNAARRSFNKRSDWEYWDDMGKMCRGLKDSDKRLIEFLARGMTVADFEQFQFDLSECVWDIHHNVDYKKLGYKSQSAADEGFKKEFKEMLWQWRNTPTHDTPFNHSFISFEVKAPIFVRAQLVKHEYLIMSEFSRRYITDGIEFYDPPVWRGVAENKKQGSEGVITTSCVCDLSGEHTHPKYAADDSNEACLHIFNNMIQAGVAPEQARMVLPQSTMTEWTWSGTLGAFAKMCQLRLHPDAQYEARLVAEQVYGYLKEYWPVSAKALVEGVDI